ncbi:MAG: hypothetical protein QM757_39535 [Paludibaculum sp.]
MKKTFLLTAACVICSCMQSHAQKVYDSAFIESLKTQAVDIVSGKAKNVQEMVDMVFSFGELASRIRDLPLYHRHPQKKWIQNR